MQQLQIGRVYRHFKGDYYLVEALAKDSESGEPCVIYRKLYGDGGLWVRPLAMFLSKVDREKYPDAEQEYRFVLQDIPSAEPEKDERSDCTYQIDRNAGDVIAHDDLPADRF